MSGQELPHSPSPQPQLHLPLPLHPQPRLHPSGSSSEGGAVAVQNCKILYLGVRLHILTIEYLFFEGVDTWTDGIS